MKNILNFSLIFLLLTTNILKAEIVKPNKQLKPFEVLSIQLNSLKNNNVPYKDAGIEQTWEFAHPLNKIMTGPLDSFKEMIYSKNYQLLINHVSFEATILSKSDDRFVYTVDILSKDKKKYNYVWQIERVKEEGVFKDCWMTVSVSNPKFLGETI